MTAKTPRINTAMAEFLRFHATRGEATPSHRIAVGTVRAAWRRGLIENRADLPTGWVDLTADGKAALAAFDAQEG